MNIKESLKKIDNLILIPIIIAACITPMIVKLAIVDKTLSEVAAFYLRATDYGDAFSYYKSFIIIGCAVAILLLKAYELIGILTNSKYLEFPVKYFKDPINIAVIVYLFMVLLSTILSPYKEVALKGYSERFENVFILFSYMILFLSTAHYVKSKTQVKVFIYGLLASAVVICTIGIFQYIGKDPFATEAVKDFIMGKNKPLLENFSINFPTIYATLYNPNCVGLYTSLLTPIFAALALGLPYKNIFKYVSALMTVVLVIVMVGSYTLGGFAGTAIGGIALFALSIIYYVSQKRFLEKSGVVALIDKIAIIAIAVTIFFVVLNKSQLFNQKFNILFNELKQMENETTENLFYKSILIVDGQVEIKTSQGDFNIVANEKNEIKVVSQGNIIEPVSNEATEQGEVNYRFDLGNNLDFTIKQSGNTFLYTKQSEILFGINVDGSISCLSPTYAPIDINTPLKSIGFENSQLFGNSRGYMWSKSLPIVFENIIVGSGPDTFAFNFPQHDVSGKSNMFRNSYIIVDKPHNIYIQQAINTGLISLLSLLAIFGIYVFTSLKILVKQKCEDSFILALRLGVLSGVLAYFAVAMTTDSTVSVSPVFWVILGLGFAINNITFCHSK